MLKNHLISMIRQNLGHPPTAGQQELIGHLADFIMDENTRAFIVKGYAGTGKTTLVSALVRTLENLEVRTLLLAPTGRAAKVFSAYAGKSAYTIHRKIFRQRSSRDGFGTFVLNKNLFSHMVILVDEASMISNALMEDSVFGSGRVLEDLISFVRDGVKCKLVLIGDTAQLPPVGISLSPALDRSELSAYIPVAGEYTMTDIVRQSAHSGILTNATVLRNLITDQNYVIPVFEHSGLQDIRFVRGNELTEILDVSYRKYGVDENIVLCRSNKKANVYNAGIRKQVLFREEELEPGDLLMVVKNNYHWVSGKPEIEFIANGDIVELLKVRKYTERYGFRFAYATLKLVDYQVEFEAWIVLDTLTSESAALSKEDNKKLFYSILEDQSHIKSRTRQYKLVKEDPFFNALQVKYAYAITCHKSQGGQWKAVYIDQGYISKERIDLEYLRWLYTAVTRATEELYLVDFPAEFYSTA
jgi:exodeoxyribonuclease-5